MKNSYQAVSILHQIFDKGGTQESIARIETLVNMGLASIFVDQDIALEIVEATSDHVEIQLKGDQGENREPWAVIVFILKVIDLILGKHDPVLAVTEVPFVSERYSSQLSHFIQDLAKPLPEGLSLRLI